MTNEIFKIMRSKKYYYFSGLLNDRHDYVSLDFSTGHNGRGDTIEIMIGEGINGIIKDGIISHKLNDDELLMYLDEI